MKYLLFLKEFFHKKTTKNYLLIIFALVFVITSSVSFYKYGKKIINNNYSESYFVVTLDNNTKMNKIKNHNNVDTLVKCIKLDDEIIIIDEKLNLKEISESFNRISESDFNKYDYNFEYYMTLNNWTEYNDMIDYLIENHINYDFMILKKNEINIENYYNIFFYLLILVIVIGLIIFLITIVNVLMDEKKIISYIIH